MSTKLYAKKKKKKKKNSVFRNKIQKSGFLKHTQTALFYISLHNYRRIQNKTNSATPFVSIGKENKYVKFSCKVFQVFPFILI